MSSILSVHEARHALGQRLRELRHQAGLTGRQVAQSLSWPASKVSKLENGRQTPTDDDVRGWASVTHAGAETESLLASLYGVATPVHHGAPRFNGKILALRALLAKKKWRSRVGVSEKR